MKKDSKIYVAGHNGMVGSAIVRKLQAEGYTNIITRTSKELDLRHQRPVRDFFVKERPEYVFLAAAKVGGIAANNNRPVDFLYYNLQIQNNIISSAHRISVKKLLFLGSSCIYPRVTEQPIHESALLTGSLEPTNEPYAIAKIAGIKMCQAYNKQYGDNFISAMPTNLYGQNDNYDLENSHVLPALMHKIHLAKIHKAPFVEIWGTGKPRREFLHVDDLADACMVLMQKHNIANIVNVGTGKDIPIDALAFIIKETIRYEGALKYNTEMPDGTPRKLLDVSFMRDAYGWQSKIDLVEGIKKVYLNDFLPKFRTTINNQ